MFFMTYNQVSLTAIKEARQRIADEIVRTPLVRLNLDDAPAEIYLKLEVLQPIRSFKIRAACNAMKTIDKDNLREGVWTASSGNWAQGVAWYARKLGVKCTIVVPENVSVTKQNALSRLGAQVVKASITEWMKIFETRNFKGIIGQFVHPSLNPAVMAGNGTIGLEILEDLPDVDTVIIPWGGGSLSCGIASAIRLLQPNVNLFACEVSTSTPLAHSFAQDRAATEIPYTPSFVEGIGYPIIFPEMWYLAKKLLDGSLVVSLEEIIKGIQLLAEHNSIIAEGAGAASVAAALSGKAGGGKLVCVVSGGNIDSTKLIKILQGKTP
jgi:threonine dehydratase